MIAHNSSKQGGELGRQNNQVLSGGPIYQRRVHFISRRAIGITHGGPSRRLRFIVRFDPPSSRSSLDRTRLLPLRVLGLVWVTVNGQRSAEQTVTTQDRPRHLIMLQRTRARRKQHEWAENNTRTMRSSDGTQAVKTMPHRRIEVEAEHRLSGPPVKRAIGLPGELGSSQPLRSRPGISTSAFRSHLRNNIFLPIPLALPPGYDNASVSIGRIRLWSLIARFRLVLKYAH